MGHVCYICVNCLEGIVCGMSWLVDDLWYRCNVVNFDSHISNVVGYCMCGMAGDTLICGSQGKKTKKKTKKEPNKEKTKKQNKPKH